MELLAEDLVVRKRVQSRLVRAIRTTETHDRLVEADLVHDRVTVERVAVGRVVEAVPLVRQEGDVTILPVVEEEVVVVRRLVLREEVHLRRTRTTERHAEVVTLRRQRAAITHTDLDDGWRQDPAHPSSGTIPTQGKNQ